MIDSKTAPYAALLLRVSLGVLFLAHAGLKFFVFTPAGTAKFFDSVGLPPTLAYVTIAVEVLGGIALILGLWTRIAAIVLMPILLGAIFTVHGAAGFFFTNAHGGWEYRISCPYTRRWGPPGRTPAPSACTQVRPTVSCEWTSMPSGLPTSPHEAKVRKPATRATGLLKQADAPSPMAS